VNVVEDELKKGGPIEAEGNLLTRNVSKNTGILFIRIPSINKHLAVIIASYRI